MSLADAELVSVSFDQLQGWSDEDHRAALAAFLPGAARMLETPYKTKALQIDEAAYRQCCKIALQVDPSSSTACKAFFETQFEPLEISVGPDPFDGFVTGFFEPVVEASKTPSAQFPIPLYRRPPDLIDIDDDNRPSHIDPYFRFAQMKDGHISPFFDRAAISAGALEGQGLEIAYVKDKVTAFFIHVQGSAKLKLDEGETVRITYSAKTGHPYTSVAKVLCAEYGFAPEEMTADKLADWMYQNPDKIDALLAHNRSYIFFERIDDIEPEEGPVAAAKIPLIAGRSLAVDKTIHTYGLPFWVSTREPLPESDKSFSRLMMAHDTGSAIVGPARGDFFVGSGDEAGSIAGRIRHDASLTVLVPKP